MELFRGFVVKTLFINDSTVTRDVTGREDSKSFGLKKLPNS
jgi:hypothetical protein